MRHPYLSHVLGASQVYDKWTLETAARYGYLPYMIRRYVEILGRDETLHLLEANETPLPDYIRCNDYLIDCENLSSRLSRKGVKLVHDPRFSPLAYRVDETPVSLGALHEHLMGYYFIQGPASMSVVHALEPKKSEIILDMAAAPGGKATQILQLTKDNSILIAIEKNKKRIKSLRSNLQRMRFTRYAIVRADSRFLRAAGAFDRVLLDAPSTGEGVIRKDPSRKRSRTPDDLKIIHELQVDMLLRAIDYAREGATIVYSACTLAPEEGEMVIDTVLKYRNNIIDIEPLPLSGLSPGITRYFGVEFDQRVSMCGRFWPHRQGTEGFFVCRLIKRHA